MRLEVFDLGLVEYLKAWEFQKEIFSEVQAGWLDAALILCRHYPVITLGRQGKRANILLSEGELKGHGIKFYAVERGGDVTYHGPGQITAYPIFNLKYFKQDLHWFLRYLEDAIMDLLSQYGVSSIRQPGLTGVWIGDRKIASIGIAVRQWITWHGLSINVKRDDLANFRFLRACGLDVEMTSLESVLGRSVDIEDVKAKFLGTPINPKLRVSPVRDSLPIGLMGVPG
jgi:lipoate-protein ligase B